MTQQDYEAKKRECLEEFCKLHECETPHDHIVETFAYAFDRAYALGKQEQEADTADMSWGVLSDDTETLAAIPNLAKSEIINYPAWSLSALLGLLPKKTVWRRN